MEVRYSVECGKASELKNCSFIVVGGIQLWPDSVMTNVVVTPLPISRWWRFVNAVRWIFNRHNSVVCIDAAGADNATITDCHLSAAI